MSFFVRRKAISIRFSLFLLSDFPCYGSCKGLPGSLLQGIERSFWSGTVSDIVRDIVRDIVLHGIFPAPGVVMAILKDI